MRSSIIKSVIKVFIFLTAFLIMSGCVSHEGMRLGDEEEVLLFYVMILIPTGAFIFAGISGFVAIMANEKDRREAALVVSATALGATIILFVILA